MRSFLSATLSNPSVCPFQNQSAGQLSEEKDLSAVHEGSQLLYPFYPYYPANYLYPEEGKGKADFLDGSGIVGPTDEPPDQPGQASIGHLAGLEETDSGHPNLAT